MVSSSSFFEVSRSRAPSPSEIVPRHSSKRSLGGPFSTTRFVELPRIGVEIEEHVAVVLDPQDLLAVSV